MKKLIYFSAFAIFTIATSCSKTELDVKNPNEPTFNNIQSEPGIISYALGGIYRNGFNGINTGKYGWLGDSYWSIVPAYHELMGDVVGASAANNLINQVGVPDKVTYDNGTSSVNTAKSKAVLRLNNTRTNLGSNPFYYEWTFGYFMNNACNIMLDNIDKVTFSGDAATKKNTIKAWAYFWKGFAYARIGSMYYAGLINDAPIATNNKYVTSAAIITESNANFDKAIAALGAVPSAADYNAILGKIIPDFCQTGKGGILTPAMWIRNINTMKARNLLVNKKVSAMTATDWAALATLANNGITATDLVFTGRAPTSNNFFSPSGGTVAIRALTDAGTYTVNERLIQDFKTGDRRYTNNFILRANPVVDAGGTFIYGTRYEMVDGGTGLPGVITWGSKTAGAFELYLAGTYEENDLMRAEALIRQGGQSNIDQGVAIINAVRTSQGAGLTPLAAGLTSTVAVEELRKERRIGLAFRGLSFYDARRWGVIDPISAGGGRTGCVVYGPGVTSNTNATIEYGFLDYWDVPDDETSVNPPATGSAPVKNPR
jgi:starch-binding outer membrane protein, SusD/RagB family